MNLPSFDIPIPPLGFDIPLLMHPPIVHFAIVLPIVILILELINLLMKRRGLTITALTFFIFLMIIYAAAYITGKTDGSEAYEMLSKAGQADLKEHKLIGTYLMLGTVVLFFLKLFAMALRTWWMKLLYMLALIGFVAAVFYQGKEGGELVYKYGANNERVMDLSSELDDLQEELEELKEANAESEEATEEASAEEAPAKEEVEEKKEATKEAAPAKEEEQPAKASETETKEQSEASEEQAPAAASEEKAAEGEKATESTEEEATPAEANATEGAAAVKEKVQEAAQSAAENVKEVAKEASESAKEAVESVKDAAGSAIDKAKEMMGNATPAH